MVELFLAVISFLAILLINLFLEQLSYGSFWISLELHRIYAFLTIFLYFLQSKFFKIVKQSKVPKFSFFAKGCVIQKQSFRLAKTGFLIKENEFLFSGTYDHHDYIDLEKETGEN